MYTVLHIRPVVSASVDFGADASFMHGVYTLYDRASTSSMKTPKYLRDGRQYTMSLSNLKSGFCPCRLSFGFLQSGRNLTTVLFVKR